MNKKSISILIINWNSKDYLEKCLSIIEKTCQDLYLQIIVVDSGSFDGCEKVVKKFKSVKFIQSDENLGFGQANNVGFKYVKNDLLLLLNPDTEIKPRSIHVLIEALQKLPQAGIVAPKLLNSDGSIQRTCVRAAPTPLNCFFDAAILQKFFPNSSLWGSSKVFTSSRPVEVEAVSGACMLLKTETFKRVGGFTKDFFMYGEDMDLCAKVRRIGLKIYHVPDAIVVHHGGCSTKSQLNEFSIIMLRESWFIYILNNYGKFSAYSYKLLQFISAILRLLFLSFYILTVKDKNKTKLSIKKWIMILLWSIKAKDVKSLIKKAKNK